MPAKLPAGVSPMPRVATGPTGAPAVIMPSLLFMRAVHHAAELRQCDSAKYLRLQALRNRHGYHTLDNAAQWVEQQKAAGRFKGDVVGPLGLEMQIKLTRYAHYLEQVRIASGSGVCRPDSLFRHVGQVPAQPRCYRWHMRSKLLLCCWLHGGDAEGNAGCQASTSKCRMAHTRMDMKGCELCLPSSHVHMSPRSGICNSPTTVCQFVMGPVPPCGVLTMCATLVCRPHSSTFVTLSQSTRRIPPSLRMSSKSLETECAAQSSPWTQTQRCHTVMQRSAVRMV